MLQHREYTKYKAQWSARFWDAMARAVAVTVVPVLRLLCRLFPSFGRAMADKPSGRLGAAYRMRDRGDHQSAFSASMEGLARYEWEEKTGRLTEFMADLNWWHFLDLATDEAEHLGEDERAKVVEALDRAPCPGGMLAAFSLYRVSVWRWRAGDRDVAIKLAKQTILADPSWPSGHVLLGWFGLISGQFDALPHLREALKADPACAKTIRGNTDFVAAPGLMESLGLTDAQSRRRGNSP